MAEACVAGTVWLGLCGWGCVAGTVWLELCGWNLRYLPVGASRPVRPCGATLPTAWAPSREAADGHTVPEAPAGYVLINVIDIVSRNIG